MATKEYITTVVKAQEERDAAHAVEKEVQKEAIKADDLEDPVVGLLHVTRKAAHAQSNKAVEAFLASIKDTLKKHVPIHAQGPLISNALSTAFQFQMSMWRMIGEECICPLQAKHSDWCSLAGIVQAIVKMFPKNCALMFPPPPVAAPTFSSTFKPDSSDDHDDNDNTFGTSSSFRQFESSSPTPSSGMHGGFGRKGHSSTYTSTPLLHGGAFTLASDPKGVPSSSLGMAPAEDEEPGSQPGDDDLDMALEADDEGKGKQDPASDEPSLDPADIELLLCTINPVINNQLPPVPKSGDK